MHTNLLGLMTAGASLVPTARGAALAQGCHDVLSVLGVMFCSSGMGEAFGYAVVLGAHRVNTLQEVRCRSTLWCDSDRRRPINVGRDMALPSLGRSVRGFRIFTDAILLATAGGVALADPMVVRDGKIMSTSYTLTEGDVTDAGVDVAGEAADAASMTAHWAAG